MKTARSSHALDSIPSRLRPKEAAEILGVKPKTLAQWRCAGTGPEFHKVGGLVFYYLDSLLRFLEEAPSATSTAQVRIKQEMSKQKPPKAGD